MLKGRGSGRDRGPCSRVRAAPVLSLGVQGEGPEARLERKQSQQLTLTLTPPFCSSAESVSGNTDRTTSSQMGGPGESGSQEITYGHWEIKTKSH